jgi:NitT/TauT family transport system substrate-binding protein
MLRWKLQVAAAVAAVCCLAVVVTACGGGGSSSSSSESPGSSGPSGKELTKVKYQLSWLPSQQFAGLFLAQEKGFFEKHGLEVELIAGGPSVNPITAIANGSADLGDSQPSSVVLARAQGLPLTQVYQLQQESGTVYVAKKSSGIENLDGVKGKRVGLYFGGYQAEFLSMLEYAGINQSEVNMIPQPSTMVPFLEGKYDVAMATLWNELLTIEEQVPEKELTIMRPSEYGGGLVGTSIATTEEFIEQHPKELQQFLDAAAEGWIWALEHPDEAAKLMTEQGEGLNLSFEERGMAKHDEVICTGPTLETGKGLGYITPEYFEQAQEILLNTGQIEETQPTEGMFETKFWEAIPNKFKHPNCGADAAN